LVTVAPADIVELITVGVGLGVGVGVGVEIDVEVDVDVDVEVGVGVGDGIGVGRACALAADMAASPMARPRPSNTARDSQRPLRILPAREGRDEPRMN
jgi:hypothetical protein